MFNVYIGYDEREDIAARVCKHSILTRTDLICPPNVYLLRSADILEYTRPKEPNQSTDFTYTRFMIPYLEGYGRHHDFSVFCDCDFLFQTDIMDLVYNVDKTKAVSVVKHPAYIPRTEIKMDGIQQHVMPRKNWASLIVFNNKHIANSRLTLDYVNHCMPGRRLHQFDWLQDEEIGSLPLEWNTLDDYYLLENPKAIHYTDGGPWFDNYKKTMYSQQWWEEYYDFTDVTRQQRILSPTS
jgi:hypothetical protein